MNGAKLRARLLAGEAVTMYTPHHVSSGLAARLVELGWELAEAPGTAPSDLAHMVELLHAGSMIVDDIEDGSQRRRGEPALHVLHGVPLALNTGNLLYFLPLGLLRRLRLGANREGRRREHREDDRVRSSVHATHAVDQPLQHATRGDRDGDA